jgi:hypothetical protein
MSGEPSAVRPVRRASSSRARLAARILASSRFWAISFTNQLMMLMEIRIPQMMIWM